ncbi:uncharacterized protein BO97DRAFT_257335 [Aspergillus homomorphus CBS 101889]|uniref:Gamma-glutamylcyclotransferase AIG2-like domain-containing protein n=1 Tax=Aspergillus homomorphus (strain CBS 101889) TaxID=1450537 RepID=A0A395I4A6_ASPHC|nr:hypothetical protein BO97DRAFT_257335 [Aspergillus homomorphus CBS 101889]RAL14807.1 hypothetical protein BO97DRAFT_257335 [Aspergillus homomorphus CBS 101889]
MSTSTAMSTVPTTKANKAVKVKQAAKVKRSRTTMECFTWYPDNYKFAFHNRLKITELEKLQADEEKQAVFVYGILKLPSAVRAYLGKHDSMEIARRMQPAKAIGYRLYERVAYGEPYMAYTGNNSDVVEGMLVFALDWEDIEAIFGPDHEGGNMDSCFVEVETVIVEDGPGLADGWVEVSRTFSVPALVWLGSTEGMRWKGLPVWAVDTFLRSELYDQFRRPGELESEETITLY